MHSAYFSSQSTRTIGDMCAHAVLSDSSRPIKKMTHNYLTGIKMYVVFFLIPANGKSIKVIRLRSLQTWKVSFIKNDMIGSF